MNIKFLIVCILYVTSISTLYAAFEISGKLNLKGDWQRQLFLATVNKLDDFYKANPSDIIQVGRIQEDGTFLIKGDNLPLERRFYRLYLVKEENSEFDACLYADEDDHNFVHLILDNETKLKITADPNHFSPFGNYTLEGDEENQSLAELSHLIFPSFNFYQIKFPSELQFTEQKLNRDLFDFAERSIYPLVGLAALYNTDMDEYYPLENEKYEAFGKKLKANYPNHNYTEDYFRKLNYYSGNNHSSSIPSWIYSLLGLLSIGLLMALRKINNLQNTLFEKGRITQEKNKPTVHLSKQEEKILYLILEDKSNKEIAAELFIELSTVKTHINKLYSKLGVKNRTEAKQKAKSSTSIRV